LQINLNMKHHFLFSLLVSCFILGSCGPTTKNNSSDTSNNDTVPGDVQFSRIVSRIDSSPEYKQDQIHSSPGEARAAMDFIVKRSEVISFFKSSPDFERKMSDYVDMLKKMDTLLNSEPLDRWALSAQLSRLDGIGIAIMLQGSLGPGDLKTPLEKLTKQVRAIIKPLIPPN
jgi:hypothetical protein